ncbi:MAG: sigma-54 dependent transcriptional regulator, partial [Pseudomonadota bacterium]
RQILTCDEMVLLVLNEDRSSVYVLLPSNMNVIRDVKSARAVVQSLEKTPGRMFSTKAIFRSPLVPEIYDTAAGQAIIPLESEGGVMGCLLIACPGSCLCDIKDSDVVRLILDQVVGVIQRAILQEERMNEIRGRVETSSDFAGIIGRDPKMQMVYRLIEDIARTDAGVLIQGESGTGKELAARAVHELSDRKDKAFVVINCSAYPDTLLESELFGYEKGAFTGATRTKPGRFEQADGGTVFLDEIGEIPPQAQVKLLRVLQTQAFERLGGESTVRVNVRVIAATNKDLLKEVRKGGFREDLFYRLNVIPIYLPPLRDRRNDIPLLAAHFLKRFVSEQGKEIRTFSPEAMRLIVDCPWPGNVRELENSIEHAVVLAQGTRIGAGDLPQAVRSSFSPTSTTLPLMEDAERTLVEKVLADCGWNKKKAARELGIGRSTLYSKIRRFGLSKPTLQ